MQGRHCRGAAAGPVPCGARTVARFCGALAIFITAAGPRAVAANELVGQRRLIELGGFLGVLHPSKAHELFERGTTHDTFDAAVTDIGFRLSYMHFAFLGGEAELAMMPSGTSSGRAALIYAARAHGIVQYPVWNGLTPFALLGGGIIGVASGFGAVGSDVDPAFHWGLGLKYYVTRALAVRADFRHDITSGLGFGNADHFEFLLGAAWVIGWRTDSDGDGIFDQDDRCPRQGSEREDGCPPLDSDGDGVIDERDACPQQRGLDANGCLPPEEDIDGDGIPHERDKCPRQPETVNGYDDEDGCPDDLPSPLKGFNAAVQGVVTFASGKTRLTRSSFAVLDQVAAQLKSTTRSRCWFAATPTAWGGRTAMFRSRAAAPGL